MSLAEAYFSKKYTDKINHKHHQTITTTPNKNKLSRVIKVCKNIFMDQRKSQILKVNRQNERGDPGDYLLRTEIVI